MGFLHHNINFYNLIMSLALFHRMTSEYMSEGDSENLNQRILKAQEMVRDDWLSKGNYKAIVSAILGNWTSGNCVEFMSPVTKKLIIEGEMNLHRLIWARTIKRQVKSLFKQLKLIKKENLNFEEILGVDTEKFDPYDLFEYSDHKIAAAFFLKEVVKSLQIWSAELKENLFNSEEPEKILDEIKKFKLPEINI